MINRCALDLLIQDVRPNKKGRVSGVLTNPGDFFGFQSVHFSMQFPSVFVYTVPLAGCLMSDFKHFRISEHAIKNDNGGIGTEKNN